MPVAWGGDFCAKLRMLRVQFAIDEIIEMIVQEKATIFARKQTGFDIVAQAGKSKKAA